MAPDWTDGPEPWPTPEAAALADAEHGGPPWPANLSEHALHHGMPPTHLDPVPDWVPRDLPADDPRCEECGQPGHGSWQCSRLDPAPLGGRGDWHNCLAPTNPACQGECGGW